YRSAGVSDVRRTDQLHDGFETEALPDRGQPASAGAHRFARGTGRPSVHQNTVSDVRDFALRTERPSHRADARRLSRLRCILPAYHRQPDTDPARGRYRAEGPA